MSILPDVFISEKEIKEKVIKLGKNISQEFENSENLVIIGVLKGAYIFTADLVRNINNIPLQIEFVKIASYGDSTESTGVINTPYLSLPSNITGQNILIVEDIIDTGRTASFLKQYIQEQFRPKSLKIASLLNKPSRREVKINPDYCCFEIEDKFVVGYGLDYAEKYRELSYLGVLNNNLIY